MCLSGWRAWGIWVMILNYPINMKCTEYDITIKLVHTCDLA